MTPSSQQPGTSRSGGMRDRLLDGLPSKAREEVILAASKLGIEEDDPMIKLFLIIRENDASYKQSVSAMTALKGEVLKALKEAPDKLTQAVTDIMRVSQLNREEAIQNRENASAGRNLIKWGIGIACAAVVATIIQVGLIAHTSTIISEIRNERLSLVEKNQQAAERVEVVQHLQALTSWRLRLEREDLGIKHEWENLRQNWRVDGATGENQRLKETLEEMMEELSEKFDRLEKEEERAFAR